jgi:MFS family permease
MAWGTVGVLAALKLAVHLYALEGYGIFRDELYYLACAEHLDWGYVDHPALSIFLLWLWKGLFGTSLVALRVLPALVGVATLVLVAATAREMGGGRRAQALAATAALIVPVYLAYHHYYSMNAWSVFFWAATGWLLARLLRTGQPRLWIWIGVVLGLGLANKIDVLWLGAGLGVGLVLEWLLRSQPRWLTTRWPWIAGAISMVGLAPYVAWQMGHEWATLEFIHNATTQKMASVSVMDFLLGQILTLHPFTLPIWLGGLVFLLVHPRGKRFRLLAWIFLTVAALLAFSGTSRSGYLAPAYTWLFAAGGVAVVTLLARWRIEKAAWALVVILLAGGALVAPLALPVLPVERYQRYAAALGKEPSTEENKEVAALPQFYADMHGWREITATVVEVFQSLPEEEQGRARVTAPDYGIAGALDYYGRPQGLPPTLSGHNNYWYWGPADLANLADPVILQIGGDKATLEQFFETVELAAHLDCGLCMPYENGRPVWICRGFHGDLSEVWRRSRHFD